MSMSSGDGEMTDQEFDIMNMSDEDFAALDPNDFGAPAEQEEAPEEGADLGEQETEEPQEAESEEEGEPEESEETDESDPEEESEAEDQGGDPSSDEPADDDEETESEEKSEEEGPDYKAVYEDLFQPFKANGKEIKVESVEDARQLMQMGANYSKKMTALKPNLKTLKLLEDNNLLGDDKINYLIDVASGKPEAIQRLLKESKVDPLDLNLEEADNYEPTARNVTDKRMALDGVLDDLKDSDHYDKLIDAVGTEWDETSRHKIADAPGVLEIINDHMATGIYDRILAEVEREKMYGRLDGLCSIDAYHKVGDMMYARGDFAEPGKSPTGTPAPAPAASKPSVDPIRKAQEEQARKSKKRAAASTRKAPTSGTPADFNPLSLSDEEFEKLSSKYS